MICRGILYVIRIPHGDFITGNNILIPVNINNGVLRRLVGISTERYLAKGGVLSSGSAVVGEAGPELLTMSGGRAVVEPLTGRNQTTNLGGVKIYVYGAPGQDVNDLADIIMDKMEFAVQRKGAVYGA